MASNPGLLGTSEIRIPVPWGHIAGFSQNFLGAEDDVEKKYLIKYYFFYLTG